MFTRTYWIDNLLPEGRIGIMPRPSGNEDLEADIQHLSRQSVGMLVSLLTSAEISELGLRKEGELCAKYQITFLNFPIEDRQVPKNPDAVKQLAV